MDRVKVIRANAIKGAWYSAPDSKAKNAMLELAKKLLLEA